VTAAEEAEGMLKFMENLIIINIKCRGIPKSLRIASFIALDYLRRHPDEIIHQKT
jgi:hypothetical protein